MIFFKCFGPNFYILPENRLSTLTLCGCGCTTVYRIYLHRRGNRATDLQFVVAKRAYCFDLGRALAVATAF